MGTSPELQRDARRKLDRRGGSSGSREQRGAVFGLLLRGNGTVAWVVRSYLVVMPVTSKRRHERAGKRYSDLKAWQACHAFVLAIYNKTSSWPEEEKYGLTGQIRRAAVSSAVNIAEGSAKASRAEFRRYLSISLGSLTEAACLLELARDLHLLDQSTFCDLRSPEITPANSPGDSIDP